MAERPRHLILIRIIRLREWSPLSKTRRLDYLLDNITEQQSENLYDDFAHWLLEVYRRRVQNTIRTQRFPVNYAPLSPAWKKKKEKKGWHSGFWIATGMLMRNLKVWKYGGVYHIGFPEHHVHPVHGRPYASICRSLEAGVPVAGIPARPLFTPIGQRMSRDIFYLFRTFLRMNRPSYLKYVEI